MLKVNLKGSDALGILVILIWSTTLTFIKLILEESNNNFLTVAVAYNFVAFILTIFAAIGFKEHKKLLTIKSRKRFFFLVFLNGLYDILLVAAVAFANVQLAIISNYLWPILLVLFIGIKHGRPSLYPIIGSLLGFSALLLLAWPDRNWVDMSTNNLIGISLGTSAALVWAAYSAILEKADEPVAISIQGLSQLVSTVLGFALAMYFGKLDFSDILNVKAMSLILIYAAINMSLAYVLWIFVVVRHAELERFASMIYILPVSSLLFSTFWYGVSRGYNLGLSIGLILLGIFVARLSLPQR